MKWMNEDIHKDELTDNEYLKIYPFSQYDVNGTFTQSNAEVKQEQIKVSAAGCAVLVRKEKYDDIIQVNCEVLNASTCKQESLIHFLPNNNSVFSVKKYVEGYRDEEFFNKNIEITGEDLARWFKEFDEEDIVVIPNCFSLSYNFDDYDKFEIHPISSENQDIVYHLFVDKFSEGIFIEIEQIKNGEKVIVSNQYVRTKLTLFK